MRKIPDELSLLSTHQHGLLSVAQLLAHGVDGRCIQRRIDAGLWQRLSCAVILTHGQPPDRLTVLTAASLHYPKLGLTGTAALECVGLPTPHQRRIDLIGPRGGRIEPFRSCVVHTTRHAIDFPISNPDRVGHTMSVVHAMSWAASRRQAVFFGTWAVQRRLTTLADLQELVRSQPISSIMRRAAPLIASLDEGVHSIHEFDFLAACRRRGLPDPARQTLRCDSTGRDRFTDAEFRVNGHTLVVEIDGLAHLQAEVNIDDSWRANELTMQGATVLRIPGLALTLNPDPFFLQLEQSLSRLRNAA